MDTVDKDRFEDCEMKGCDHDLTAGVLIADLLNRDGPYSTRRVGDGGNFELHPPPNPVPEAA